MAPLTWQSRMDLRAAALTAGRYDLMVEEYAYPLTVYLNGAPVVLRDRAEAWGMFQSLHSLLVACGLTQITAQLVAEDLPRDGRVRLWTDWTGAGPSTPPRVFASTVCYARTGSGTPLTEMLEFTRLDLQVPVPA